MISVPIHFYMAATQRLKHIVHVIVQTGSSKVVVTNSDNMAVGTRNTTLNTVGLEMFAVMKLSRSGSIYEKRNLIQHYTRYDSPHPQKFDSRIFT